MDEAQRDAAVAAEKVAKAEGKDPEAERENAAESSERMIVEGSPEEDELAPHAKPRPSAVEEASEAAKFVAQEEGADPQVEAENAAEAVDTMLVEGSPDDDDAPIQGL